MEKIGLYFTVVVLATVVEAMLEYVLGIWWRPLSEELRPKVLMAVGLALGIALCLWYKADLPAEVLGLTPSIVGQIVTGALVGRGAEYVHQFYNKLKS